MAHLVTIQASQWVAPERAITDSAEDAARAAVAELSSGHLVEIDLSDVRGVPSSYFNLLLIRIAEAHGVAALDRVSFRFATAVQRSIFDRSAKAVRDSLA